MIRIYYNSHKGCFSVQDKVSRRIVGHTHDIIVRNAKFIVQPAGRKKARATGQKNVHAYVDGERAGELPFAPKDGVAVFYNPFVCDNFTLKGYGRLRQCSLPYTYEDAEEIHKAEYVHLTTKVGSSYIYAYGEIEVSRELVLTPIEELLNVAADMAFHAANKSELKG